MCSQFRLKIDPKKFCDTYQIINLESIEDSELRVLPYRQSLVILNNQLGQPEIRKQSFSLIPSWSKEPKLKFATHNARIETVTEKPTWRGPIKKNHCLIPMSGFYEAVYEGQYAGNVIEFKPSNEEILFAAGIYDDWKSSDGKQEIESFAILTTEPNDFIKSNGHDRCPIFLPINEGKKWLDHKMGLEFLLEKKSIPELIVSIDRPLKEGWEKRRSR